MSRPVALYTDIVDTDPTGGIELLEAAGWRVRVANSADPDVIAHMGADASALLIGYSPVTAELLERLPALRIVATQSVGFDMVDVRACGTRGIVVTNVPASAVEEVSVHALALALSLVRGLPFFDRASMRGEWGSDVERGLQRPSTLTVGVLGLGRIGRRFAEIAAPLFGDVIGYDPASFETPGITRGSLEAVLEKADVLSLHLPLSDATHHLLDADRLALLPAGARIVNVSRGALIDSAALVSALDSGRVSCAALDVLEQEPPAPSDPLLRHPRTLVTPHVAFLTDQSERDYVLHQAANVEALVRTGVSLSPVVL